MARLGIEELGFGRHVGEGSFADVFEGTFRRAQVAIKVPSMSLSVILKKKKKKKKKK